MIDHQTSFSLYAKRFFLILTLMSLVLVGCERPDPEVTVVVPQTNSDPPPTPVMTPHSDTSVAPPTPISQVPSPTLVPLPSYVGTPTPDPPHAYANNNSEPFLTHYIAPGETLGYVAQIYGSSIQELQVTNNLAETDLVFVGQEILIPTQVELLSPSFKIVPDSELVYGPDLKDFDVAAFVSGKNGYLSAYQDEVEGRLLSGAQIVSLVSHRYSVSPRLLLAILEYRTGWVTRFDVDDNGYPLHQANSTGLYQQLGWAANELNWGFYGRAEGGISTFLVGAGTRVAFAADINHATAGVQNMLAAHEGASYDIWLQDVGPSGLFATFSRLFGNPFAFTVDPLWPDSLKQPPLQLPWTSGESWYFTGGPHGGWASGAAWAALDFAPPDDDLGYCQSDYWAIAMADGVVARSDFGAVVVDHDGDGFAGTGWAVTYMHLESRDRVPAGTFVQTGDRLGHPSCEGGYANAKHIHLSRSYNGRWVAADGAIPFEMNGWISEGLGREYDGQLVRGGVIKEACDGCRQAEYTITAD